MTYELEFLRDAWREWEKLDKTLKAQFKKKLLERLENPRVESARLRNFTDCYKIKLRRQCYRLVYLVEDKRLVVLVVAVGKRESNMVYAASRSESCQQKPSSKLVPPANSSSSPLTSPSQNCAFCGREGIQLREVTRSFGRGRMLPVIEAIPLWSCPHCGESYFTAQTMHEIERIKELRKSIAVTREFPVAVFHGLYA